MKRTFLLLSLACFIFQIHAYTVNDISDYVLSNLIQLFYPLNDAFGYESLDSIKKYDRIHHDHINSDMMQIKQTIEDELWWYWFDGNDPHVIDRVIIEKIIDFVEKKSRKIAYEKTKSKRVSSKVAKAMIQKVEGAFNASSVLERGVFRNYIGKSLEWLIRDSCNRFDEPHAPHSPHNLFPSDECCICYEPFEDIYVERLFLMPCGHDMCKECARKWFFEYHKKTCPKCRIHIDLEDLRKAVFAPSAPTFKPWDYPCYE